MIHVRDLFRVHQLVVHKIVNLQIQTHIYKIMKKKIVQEMQNEKKVRC